MLTLFDINQYDAVIGKYTNYLLVGQEYGRWGVGAGPHKGGMGAQPPSTLHVPLINLSSILIYPSCQRSGNGPTSLYIKDCNV